MKHMVREKKHNCWRAFSEDSGEQSPLVVVRWARDPWQVNERMGRLNGQNVLWLDGEEDRVRYLVSEVFDNTTEESEPW